MPRGGKRNNAGRPAGTGHYGEKTMPMRIPLSRVDEVKALISHESEHNVVTLPLFSSKVAAGLPTQVDENIDDTINLNDLLVRNLNNTFMVKAIGESMINAGIQSDDLMIVDKSLEPQNGRIVIAAVDGELTVKRLHRKDGQVQLLPENPDFKPIDITEHNDVHILGVVTNVIHPFT